MSQSQPYILLCPQPLVLQFSDGESSHLYTAYLTLVLLTFVTKGVQNSLHNYSITSISLYLIN